MKKSAIAALAAVLAATAVLSACATATPYQPRLAGARTSGGFSEVRVAPDRFRVTFAGNTLTSRETVERYLLYRAAEVTLDQGFDSFVLADRQTDRTQNTYVDDRWGYGPGWGPGFGYGYWRPSWRYYGAGWGWRSWDPFMNDPFWASRVDVRTVEKFEASADIVMRKGAPSSNTDRTFDARAVISDLGPTIVRPKPS